MGDRSMSEEIVREVKQQNVWEIQIDTGYGFYPMDDWATFKSEDEAIEAFNKIGIRLVQKALIVIDEKNNDVGLVQIPPIEPLEYGEDKRDADYLV